MLHGAEAVGRDAPQSCLHGFADAQLYVYPHFSENLLYSSPECQASPNSSQFLF